MDSIAFVDQQGRFRSRFVPRLVTVAFSCIGTTPWCTGCGFKGKGPSLVLTDNLLKFRVHNGQAGELELTRL